MGSWEALRALFPPHGWTHRVFYFSELPELDEVWYSGHTKVWSPINPSTRNNWLRSQRLVTILNSRNSSTKRVIPKCYFSHGQVRRDYGAVKPRLSSSGWRGGRCHSLLKMKVRSINEAAWIFTVHFSVRVEIPELTQNKSTEILRALRAAPKISLWQWALCSWFSTGWLHWVWGTQMYSFLKEQHKNIGFWSRSSQHQSS